MFLRKELEVDTTELDRQLQKQVSELLMCVSVYLMSRNYKTPCFECHSLCRGTALMIPQLKYVDGIYLGLEEPKEGKDECTWAECQHSWLETPDGAIIDPLPVGIIIVTALLIPDKESQIPFSRNMYRKNSRITAEIDKKKIQRKSQILFHLMKEAKEKIGREYGL